MQVYNIPCTPALIVFEHCITFEMEVDYFWKQKLTGASVLFYLNRYIMLLYLLLETPFINVVNPFTGTVRMEWRNCSVSS